MIVGVEDIRLYRRVKKLKQKVKNQEKKIQELEKNLQFLSICLRVHHNMINKVDYDRIAGLILSEEELEILNGNQEY